MLGPSRLFSILVTAAVFAAGCGSAASHRSAVEGDATPDVGVRPPAKVHTLVRGGTPSERRLLAGLVETSAADPIVRARIESRRRIVFVVRRTDRASSTKGKWISLLIGRAFSDARTRDGLPGVRTITVLTPGIPVGEGRRLVIRVPSLPHPAPVASRATALVARPRLRGLSLNRIVTFGVTARRPEAAEVEGTMRNPSQYLRVLSLIAGAPPVGRGAYYELRDGHGEVMMRFGFVNGLAPRDRLVGWVRPALLARS